MRKHRPAAERVRQALENLDRKFKEILLEPEQMAQFTEPEPYVKRIPDISRYRLLKAMRSELTDIQYQVVVLHYFRRRTQAEIALALNVSEPVINKCLQGITRNHKRIAGALRRLERRLLPKGR